MKKYSKIILASNNPHKVQEIKDLIDDQFEVLSLKEVGFDIDIEETGVTLEENSHIKAKTIFEITQMPTIADDTGLEVAGLNNEPGVFSARFAGVQKSDKDNILKLLDKLADIENRSAQFRTVFTYVDDNEFVQFEGVVKGNITKSPKGEFGFGYDSVFCPNNETRTFAEMPSFEKNKISHRGRALEKLVKYLNSKHIS